MKRKPTTPLRTSTAVAMRWPDAIKREIEAAAKREGRTFSEFVRSAALREARGVK